MAFWPRRFLGLPLHPMLVHFPLAFWLCVPVFDVLTLTNGREPWWFIAVTATAVGVFIGLFAMMNGLLDFMYLSQTGSNDVRLAARHGVRTSAVWTVMSIKLIAVGLAASGHTLVVACLIVDSLACALLLQGAFFGTKITYARYTQ